LFIGSYISKNDLLSAEGALGYLFCLEGINAYFAAIMVISTNDHGHPFPMVEADQAYLADHSFLIDLGLLGSTAH